MRLPACLALASLLLLLCPPLSSADWPRWRGPAQNGHVPRGTPIPDTLPAEPPVLWQIPAGEGLASPVVAGNRVFAFDNQGGREVLRALDAASGRDVWRADIDEPFSDSQGPTGPRNTPLVDDDRVYAVSCRGELQCRSVRDGALLWRVNYVKDFQAVFIGERGAAQGAARHGNNGSPLIDGDHLLACVGGTNDAGVVCFDKRTGDVVWKSTSDQAAYAPPVVAELAGTPQVLAYTAEGLVGLSRRNGAPLWRFPVKTAFARHVTTPILAGGVAVISSHQAGLFGVRPVRNGDSWTADAAWESKEKAINYASPVEVNGHLYGLGPRRDLFCLEIDTGEVRWSQTGVFVTDAGKAYGGFLAMGDRILVLTDSGELVLFRAQPAAYEELGRAQVCRPNWCNPAYAGGVLYLRDGLRKEGAWKAIRLAGTGTSREGGLIR